jgi:hypothetical protein
MSACTLLAVGVPVTSLTGSTTAEVSLSEAIVLTAALMFLAIWLVRRAVGSASPLHGHQAWAALRPPVEASRRRTARFCPRCGYALCQHFFTGALDRRPEAASSIPERFITWSAAIKGD